MIFVYPIEHRISGLSLVIAIFFFFSFRVGYLCAYKSVVCVSLCNQLGLFGLVVEFFFFSGGFVVYLYKIEEGRRAFDSIQAQQVNERRRLVFIFI